VATYRQVQTRVKEHSGFVPKTCWIAHVLSDHGRTARLAPNRIDTSVRAYPCPPEKRGAIEVALRHFGMIEPIQPAR
jgi:hypothetical protein